jgi:formylglycine-generating enzyme required for sulfatase activity
MVAAIAAAELVVACGNTTFTSQVGETADASADATSLTDVTSPDASSSDDGGLIGCPNNGRGPLMAATANGQCIDTTEVTQSQYAAFQAALGAGAGAYVPPPDPRCPPQTYAPNSGCLGMIPSASEDLPQTCVDWCDALAFCEWAGKRLCGGVDGGADLPLPHEVDPSSQWEVACSASASQTFPYRGAYDASACNAGQDGGALAVVKSFPACVGGYPGVYDMMGNASEWVDYCDAKDSGVANQNCAKMGDSYRHLSGGCGDIDYAPRSSMTADVGFRCCSP